MCRRTPSLFIPALRYFDGLTSSFNACSARCIGFRLGMFYRHIPACGDQCPAFARSGSGATGF